MKTRSHTTPRPATFLAVESASRRAYFGHEVLRLDADALLADLQEHNGRSAHPLPASFIAALVHVVTKADA